MSALKRLAPLALACALLLSGCGRKEKAVSSTIFAMDTVMTLTLCGADKEGLNNALGACAEYLTQRGNVLSVSNENGEVHAINSAQGRPTPVCTHTEELLRDSLSLCERTGGALDITAYPAVKAWGFTTDTHRVPDAGELADLAANIDYAQVTLEDGAVTLPAGMELDLGAVAKGQAGDYLREMFSRNQYWGVTSALLDLGQSTIVAVGSKSDGSPWRIGVQDPAGNGHLGVLELADLAMGTSGGYQRFFEVDGVRYWHILDPDTAAPARTGLGSVTVVAPSALVCDGLSTALFVMGQEEALQFWRDHRAELEFEVLFIGEDGSITLTGGLEDRFALSEGHQDREVQVVHE